MLFVFPLTKYNTTLSPGFLSQRFNNLGRAVLLTSWIQYGEDFDVIGSIIIGRLHFRRHWYHMVKILSKFGEQQLVLVNYACGLNQSETGKYFEWIIMSVTAADIYHHIEDINFCTSSTLNIFTIANNLYMYISVRCSVQTNDYLLLTDVPCIVSISNKLYA